MARAPELRLRMHGAEALRAMKEVYSYDDLARITGLSPQVLSRYVSGRFLPSAERARLFLRLFKERVLSRLVLDSIEVRGGVVVNTSLLSNARLLSQVARVVASEFAGTGVTAVLTKETDGIPLATLVASYLEAKLVVAKEAKEVGVEEFVEVRQVYPSGMYTYIYVPKGLVARGDRVLIVDDVIRSGSTVRALAEVCRVARASVVGVYAILAVTGADERLSEELGVPVRVLARL